VHKAKEGGWIRETDAQELSGNVGPILQSQIVGCLQCETRCGAVAGQETNSAWGLG
jgi:hypothetical protein